MLISQPNSRFLLLIGAIFKKYNEVMIMTDVQ